MSIPSNIWPCHDGHFVLRYYRVPFDKSLMIQQALPDGITLELTHPDEQTFCGNPVTTTPDTVSAYVHFPLLPLGHPNAQPEEFRTPFFGEELLPDQPRVSVMNPYNVEAPPLQGVVMQLPHPDWLTEIHTLVSTILTS